MTNPPLAPRPPPRHPKATPSEKEGEKLAEYKNISYLCNSNTPHEAMPEILRLFGLKFYIYTRDHQPPHVHVRSQDGMAKFAVSDNVELLENAGMKSKDLKLAESIIEDNREIIINEWVKIHGK